MYHHYTPKQALERVANSDDGIYGVVCEHGTLELGYYKPESEDKQDPHDRDEVYIVRSGTGDFVVEDERQAFGPGDALFVPAFVSHHFENFSDDFEVWVMFYGRHGGE